MYDEERRNRRVYVASDADDIPSLQSGRLIPQQTMYSAPANSRVPTATVWYMRPAFLMTFSVFLFATSIGTSVYSLFGGTDSVAAPIVATNAYDPAPLQFGYEVEPFTPTDVANTEASLVAASSSFIAIEIPAAQLFVYDAGRETQTFEILETPPPDSWWHVPIGVYEVTELTKNRYSEFSNIYQPWSIAFGMNHYLNGIPYYEDNTRVPEQYRGGGIRLADDDAATLYELITPGMAVIVRGAEPEDDTFVFTRKVPDMSAEEYLIGDLKSSTVLAASDLDRVVPIASLTKLMTALVAAEHINLDQDVWIRGSGVTSLIPRLREGHSASMYSLLQLLLIESSNEAAEVIASVIGRDEFLRLMNEKAAAIGMEHTTFTDPSGLDDGNISTVSDLFRLAQYIAAHRGFILELTANQHLPTAYTDGQFGDLTNFNTMEGIDFIAGKIGETRAAGQTSLSLHKVVIDGEERIIALVVLGSEDRTSDVTRLLALLYERFEN